MEKSSITQPHKMRDEGFGKDDTRQALEYTNTQTNVMYQEITSINELDNPNHSNNTDQVTVNADIFTMDSLNNATKNDYAPSTSAQVQPPPLLPSTPQPRRLTPDTAEKIPQSDKQGQPMEQGENNPTHSDEDTHQTQTLGSPKKKKKTEWELSTYSDRTRSRSRQPHTTTAITTLIGFLPQYAIYLKDCHTKH
jgi:hypothetical protein